MGSKDRMLPNLWRPLPGSGMMRPDSFFPDPPPPGPFFDGMPPPEIMEQNLARQHMEMQKLALENERLAATHSVLRQELVAAQQELQRLHAHVGAAKAEKEQQMRGLLDKMAKMEADLQSFEPLKVELQQSCVEAESLVASRQELISKVQQLTQDLERSHTDGQQIPALLSELDGLRREYQNCRVTYDREKKLYNDHLESLQVMEKNYISMSREVEKLRAELGGSVGNATYKTNDSQVVQNAPHDGYGTSQAQGRAPPQSGASPYGGRSSGPTPAHMGYEAPRGPSHGTPKSSNYDASRGPGYDASRDSGYNPRGANYETNRAGSLDATGYDAPRGAGGYDTSRGAAYDAPRGAGGYDSRRGAGGYDVPQGVGYDGSRGPSGYEYDAIRAAAAASAGYEHPRNAGYNDPRGAVGAQAPGYDTSKVAGHIASGGAGHNVSGAAVGGVPRAAGYQIPGGAEYDAPRGSGGSRQPTYAAPYGSMQNPNLAGEAAYRGGNAQRQ